MPVKLNRMFENTVMRVAQRKLGEAARVVRKNVTLKLKRGRRDSIGDFRDKIGEGEPPHVGLTGNLSQSIFWQFVDVNTAEIGTPLKYGRWLEQGVPLITPKSGRRLAIPLSEEAQKHMRQAGGTVRNFPIATRVIVSRKTGAMLLVQDLTKPGKGVRTKGRGFRSVIHFLLVTQVHLPAHPFLRPGLIESQPEIEKIFSSSTVSDSPGGTA